MLTTLPKKYYCLHKQPSNTDKVTLVEAIDSCGCGPSPNDLVGCEVVTTER